MRTAKLLVPALCALLAACDDKTPPSSTTPPPSETTTPPADTTTPPADTTTPPPSEPSTPATTPVGGTFTYDPAGQLKHDEGGNATGQGVADSPVLYADMRFPLRCAPAYLNSQVYNAGGMQGGGFCDESNYTYPWQDNFCEKRSNPDQVSWACPAHSAIHQGQDIRANTRSRTRGAVKPTARSGAIPITASIAPNTRSWRWKMRRSPISAPTASISR
jgi:hypothetical protein